MRDVQPVTQQRFGHLVVIGAEVRESTLPKRTLRRLYWSVRCDCGAQKTIRADDVKSGHAQSCGCIWLGAVQQAFTVHGDKRSKSQAPEYVSWRGMIQRCENKRSARFKNYGGRGIKVCQRWRRGENGQSGYECFLTDVGRRPSSAHSIEREDNDGHYEPGNVRWAAR